MNKQISVLSAIILIIIVMLAMPQATYIIIPAEEGLSVGVVGWQDGLYGEVYGAKNPPTPPKQWKDGWELVSDDPHNFRFGAYEEFWSGLNHLWKRTDVRVEVGQPWHEKYQDVDYYLQTGEKFVHIQGEVWVYHLDLDFSIVNKGIPQSGVKVFESNPVWLSLVTTVWNRALQDPATGVTGTAWGAPIACYVEGYRVDSGSGSHALIEPNQIGRFVTLYDQSSSAGATIDDLGISVGADINATLMGMVSPDTRIGGPAYARWILSDFGPTTKRDILGGISKQEYPAVNYKVKVYYLSVGKWVFTKSQHEEWTDREAEYELWGWAASFVWMWDGLWKTFGVLNPFRAFGPMAGAVAFISAVLIGFGVLYLLLKVALPILLPDLRRSLRRRQG